MTQPAAQQNRPFTLSLTAQQASLIATLLPLRYSIQRAPPRRGRYSKSAQCTLTITHRPSPTQIQSDGLRTKGSSPSISQIDGNSKSDHSPQKDEETHESVDDHKNQQIPEAQFNEGLLETIIGKFLEKVESNEQIEAYFGQDFLHVRTKFEDHQYNQFSSFEADIETIIQNYVQNNQPSDFKDNLALQILEHLQEFKDIYHQIQSTQKSVSSQSNSSKSQETNKKEPKKRNYHSKSSKKAHKKIRKAAQKVTNRSKKRGQLIPNDQNSYSKKLFAVQQQNQSQTNQQSPICCETVIYINKLLSKLHRHDQEDLLKTISSESKGHSALIKNINQRQALSFIKRIKLTLQKYGIRPSIIQTNAQLVQSSFQIQSQQQN